MFPHARLGKPAWLGAKNERKAGAALKPGLISADVGWLNSGGKGRFTGAPEELFHLGSSPDSGRVWNR